MVLKIKAQQIHSQTDCQYCFLLAFLYHKQNHVDNNLCFNPKDLYSREKMKSPEWLKIGNLKKLGKGEGYCSDLIPQCWMKMGEGRKKKKERRITLGQLRWCKLSNSTNKPARRSLKAFKLSCELWLPVAVEVKLITKQSFTRDQICIVMFYLDLQIKAP